MFSKLAISLSAVNAAAVVGTNIGGWMVLEPWITPSLFYQFLNKNQNTDGVGLDSWTLCESLGPVAGNSVMQAHWASFYTADHIKELAAKDVKMVRLPIGDWTLKPYGPYVGCMDGAEDWIQWMFDTCAENGIEVLLDVHAMKDSQNGFDNSGKITSLTWDEGGYNFTHWPDNHADWMGPWVDGKMEHVNYANLQWSLDVSEGLLQRWGDHSAFGAFEPVNEPWWNTDLNYLKDFYRQVRKMTQKYAPQAYFVFHNSFRYDVGQWNDLFRDDDIEKVALDHHYYQAFNQPAFTTVEASCADYEQNASYADQFKYEVWFGEWALATDVCAHWLGGFNDGNTVPQATCQWVDCPETYLPRDIFANATVDPSIESNGPYGYGIDGDASYYVVTNGKCSKDSAHFSNEDVAAIAKCALDSFNTHLNRTFMWTAHNEIEERWSYTLSWDAGWLNPASWTTEEEIM